MVILESLSNWEFKVLKTAFLDLEEHKEGG